MEGRWQRDHIIWWYLAHEFQQTNSNSLEAKLLRGYDCELSGIQFDFWLNNPQFFQFQRPLRNVPGIDMSCSVCSVLYQGVWRNAGTLFGLATLSGSFREAWNTVCFSDSRRFPPLILYTPPTSQSISFAHSSVCLPSIDSGMATLSPICASWSIHFMIFMKQIFCAVARSKTPEEGLVPFWGFSNPTYSSTSGNQQIHQLIHPLNQFSWWFQREWNCSLCWGSSLLRRILLMLLVPVG